MCVYCKVFSYKILLYAFIQGAAKKYLFIFGTYSYDLDKAKTNKTQVGKSDSVGFQVNSCTYSRHLGSQFSWVFPSFSYKDPTSVRPLSPRHSGRVGPPT